MNIPDHVGREAVRLLKANGGTSGWPDDKDAPAVITLAKLLMNPPAPMTDPDEEAAKRVLLASDITGAEVTYNLEAAIEQMRKESEAWEAGR